MSGLLAPVRDFFVSPAGSPGAGRARVARPAPSVAVIGEGRGAEAVACGLVLALARARGDRCGLLCAWSGDGEVVRAPAFGGARRLAERLRARALVACASGRLTRVALPAEPVEAVAEAQRAVAVAPVPSAVLLARPRTDDLDALLALQDLLVVAVPPGADPALSRLAAAGLRGLRVPVVTVEHPPGAASRALARHGLAAPRALGKALAPALDPLSR